MSSVSKVAWVTSHWPHMETYGNSSPEPKHQEGPVFLRLLEGWCHSGSIPLVINFLKPGTWVPQSGDPPGPLGAHPAVWGPTLPSEVPPSPLWIHLSNRGICARVATEPTRFVADILYTGSHSAPLMVTQQRACVSIRVL